MEADQCIDAPPPPPMPIKRPRSLKRSISLIKESLTLVWESGPRLFLISIALRIVDGIGLIAIILVGRQVLDGVLANGPSGHINISSILPKLLVLALVTTVLGLAASATRELRELLGDLTGRYAQERIIETAAAVELAAYDDPTFHDSLMRASFGGETRPMQMVEGVLGLTGSMIGIVSVTAALFWVQPILVPLAIVMAIPLLLAASRVGEVMFGFRRQMTPTDRLRRYLYDVLTSKAAAKEIRAFDSAGFLVQRYRKLYDIRIRELKKATKRRISLSVQGVAGMAVVLTGAVLLLLYLASKGHMSLAAVGAAAGGILILSERILVTAMSAGSIYEASMFIDDYVTFLSLKPADEPDYRNWALPGKFKSLSANGISFAYPNSDHLVLRDVSLSIGAGEIVALVGENGSGKTTLAKLLCHLYAPHSGQIMWGDVDTTTMNPLALRQSIAVIFQDFMHYSLSAQENIGIGCAERIANQQAILAAARQSGADDIINALPHGYDTTLAPEFEDGIDLSIGQWQRVALARAFFRDAAFIILDEPTAALDARAEYELFENIRELCRGRAVLLISHRFSSVRMADRIYVLRDGEVTEHGDHNELMAADGLYAELFTLQAASYA
jgi:ATP-binding cassette subfamily B protein